MVGLPHQATSWSISAEAARIKDLLLNKGNIFYCLNPGEILAPKVCSCSRGFWTMVINEWSISHRSTIRSVHMSNA